jgi:hypothetical protein
MSARIIGVLLGLQSKTTEQDVSLVDFMKLYPRYYQDLPKCYGLHNTARQEMSFVWLRTELKESQ